jgi:hypothetical protein
MKVDVEGAEYLFIKDEAVNPSRITQIMIEFHDIDSRFETFSDTLATLVGCGYRLLDDAHQPIADVAGWLTALQADPPGSITLALVADTGQSH